MSRTVGKTESWTKRDRGEGIEVEICASPASGRFFFFFIFFRRGIVGALLEGKVQRPFLSSDG